MARCRVPNGSKTAAQRHGTLLVVVYGGCNSPACPQRYGIAPTIHDNQKSTMALCSPCKAPLLLAGHELMA